MRAARLLQIVLLLQSNGRMTAGALARRLEVSSRTIQRDLEALSSAGVPVYADRGRGGGWRLADGYRTRLTGLDPAEAAALFVGSTAHVMADLRLDRAAASAVSKLLAAIPESSRRSAELARDRILVDHSDWPGAPSASWDRSGPQAEGVSASARLDVVQQGLWEDVTVRIGYRRQGTGTDADAGDVYEVAVDPLGLVAKKRSWYLVARRADGEMRTYRASRIQWAELTDRGFERPSDFDLAEHWRLSSEAYFVGLRDYPVRLRVTERALPRLAWAPNGVIEHVSETVDGWSEVRMTFEKAHETRIWLQGLAGDLIVLEPSELRTAMCRAAEAFLSDNR